MANFNYKTVTTTTLKVAGILNVETCNINVDGTDKPLSALLADFNGHVVELVVKEKSEDELDDPTDY